MFHIEVITQAVSVLATAVLLGSFPADPAGFICPDHSVVVTADQCAAGGNKFGSPPRGPAAPFPGSGGGGSGGLLGFLHGLTGGLL